LKNSFKGILGRSANGDVIKEPFHAMLKELLTLHEKGEEKLNNLKHFTVDIHPEHKDTRCFFVVRNDDTREDFSAVKCLKNLEDKLANEWKNHLTSWIIQSINTVVNSDFRGSF